MSDTVIRVENLGKRYRIGLREKPPKTLRAAMTGFVGAPFKYLRTVLREPTAEEVIWALKDVSFEVKQGQVVGIIGRNGAGKSTLLKILSQITEPTSGYAEIRGRVGSLLEVGTGFHPDLTGRENTYLNGTIMGMKKWEIDRCFDEIVAFAEVDKFIDTPVKFYSSGMYTRLAFAVAAHLQPEILIVDEVLAVGDVEFQKKCLGKMGDVAKEGRTILFVSHNMAAIRALCSRALLMKDGQLVTDAEIETVVSNYLSEGDTAEAMVVWSQPNAPQSPEIRLNKAYILNERNEYAFLLDCRKKFFIVVEYEVLKLTLGLRIGFLIQNAEGIVVCGANTVICSDNEQNDGSPSVINPGSYKTKCTFPGYTLNAGKYSICFGSDRLISSKPILLTPYCLSFAVEDVEGNPPTNEKLPGILRPKLYWEVKPSKCIS